MAVMVQEVSRQMKRRLNRHTNIFATMQEIISGTLVILEQ